MPYCILGLCYWMLSELVLYIGCYLGLYKLGPIWAFEMGFNHLLFHTKKNWIKYNWDENSE